VLADRSPVAAAAWSGPGGIGTNRGPFGALGTILLYRETETQECVNPCLRTFPVTYVLRSFRSLTARISSDYPKQRPNSGRQCHCQGTPESDARG
jgi:hypothetical protein